MPFKLLTILVCILAANVFAAESQSEIRFIPLNSLTESVGNNSASAQAEKTDSKSLADSLYSIDFTQRDSLLNPYGIPEELKPLWNSLSIRQKAAQMVMVYMTPADFMIKNEFGGYLVQKNHLADLNWFVDNIRKVNAAMPIKPFVAIDQEGGRVNRISVISKKWEHTPSAMQMRRMPDDSVYGIAQKIGALLDSVGVNMNLAPVLDPATDSRHLKSFMEESGRSWGDDSLALSKIRAFVRGMRDNHVICVSKHFPGYDSWTNSDLQISVSATPVQRIKSNVKVFESLANDIPVTMVSSVRYVRLSSRPAVFESKIVKMAHDMSPDMVVLTDDLWGTSLRAWISGKERARGRTYPAEDFRKLVRTALLAGNDMFMITYPQKAVEMVNYLVAFSRQNKKYRARIEESAARILKMKYKAGLIGH